MARLLIEDVTLVKGQEILAHIRFSGGATRSLSLPRLLSAWEMRQLAQEVVAEIDRLLDRHTDGEVAQVMNERGVVSGTGKRFDARRVQVIRRAYGLSTREGRLQFRCYRVDDNNRFMYEDPDTRQAKDHAPSAARSEEVQYA